MKSDVDRLREIFGQAQEIESDTQRERYLTDACQGDAELRQQVDSLLMAHKEAGDFLAQTIQLPSGDFEPEPIGTFIGRYKLLEKIGEGGFGVVYMAEQQEPVQRKVALKIIKPGMDTRQVIARFEAERQALALMDHPNIAKVLDAGATEAKRPYFVMELVRGVPITEYCDQAKLSTGERLQLFVKVCQAVQHAHQKAVIHRDLKPSNILVTLHDSEPVPKVIDFGVAKALGQKLTEKTLFTAFRQMIGTPAYMAPEQAEMSGLDIDTRSDIYSLGVLLYELLTGQTPFDARRFVQAGWDEIRRIIREEEPPRPSTRLITLSAAEQTTVAARRRSDPPKLVGLVRGDLDWIVMKALEKDRKRRYETATALASDIERHLNSEPVAARPPTVSYRIHKLIRRHRLAFVAGSSVLAALLVGLAVSAIMLINERRQRIRAESAEKEALAAALESARLASALRRASGGDVNSTNYVTALTRASAGWTRERIRRELHDRPELQAGLLHFLAMRLWALREDDRSSLEMSEKGDSLESILNLQRSMLLEALTLYRQVDGSNHPIVADVLCDLASESEATGREHEEYARASLGLRKQLLGSNSLEVADSLVALANAVAFETNRYPEAQGHYLEALAIRTNRLPPDVYDVCSLYYSLADCQERNGHFAAAEQSLLHAAINDFHPDEGFVWFFARRRLILLLRKRGALPEAEERCREVLRIAREGSEPLPGELVISVQNQLAWILLDEGKLDEAQGLARDVLNSVEQTAPGGRRRFSIAQLILGAVLLEQKKYSDAEPLLISGYEEIKQHADELPNYRPLRENALQRITQLYKLWDEAVPGSGKSAQAEIWLKRLEALKRTEASTKSSSD